MPLSIIESPDLEPLKFPDATRPALAQLMGARIEHFSERPFPRLLEGQVARHPTKTAVACEEKSLTYSELNARANQLARHLRALGVGRDSVVGICIDRSLEMAVAILGILKSGGAYLPLDPEYPLERLVFMIEDARPRLVVTKSSLAKRLPGFEQKNSPLPLGEGLGERAYDSSNPHPKPPPAGEGNEIGLVF